MIKDLIFDFGGVIVDLDFEAALELFRRLGVTDIERVLDKYRQRGIFLDVETGALDAEGFLRELSALCGRNVTHAEAQQAWQRFACPVDPARLDALVELRRSHRLFLLSNTNPFMMEWACSPAFSPDGRSLDTFFDKLYLSYKLRLAKPERAIFDYVLRDAELDPATTLFVDDGQANVAAAREAGLKTYCPRPGEDWVPAVRRLIAEG